MQNKPLWGPWSPDLTDPVERRAQLRALAALLYVTIQDMIGKQALIAALRAGEDDPVELERARKLFDMIPALRQRQIIATLAKLM